MKLRFSAAARRELNEAAIWLELQEPGYWRDRLP